MDVSGVPVRCRCIAAAALRMERNNIRNVCRPYGPRPTRQPPTPAHVVAAVPHRGDTVSVPLCMLIKTFRRDCIGR
ncbi:hypothetical protein ACHAXH_001505 [Discostella pseudostelligera]